MWCSRLISGAVAGIGLATAAPAADQTGALRVSLPTDLCSFEILPAKLAEHVIESPRFDRYLRHMLRECPEQALQIADMQTAAISGDDGGASAPRPRPDELTVGDGGGEPAGDPGTGAGGTSGDGGGDTGGGEPDRSGDGNNGHGNNTDGNDDGNPGKSNDPEDDTDDERGRRK